MKNWIFIIALLQNILAMGQELYIFSEPASNLPAKSVSARLGLMLAKNEYGYSNLSQRYRAETYIGVSKKLMLKAGIGFANMHTSSFGFESVSLYGKYRFLSNDEMFKHFRMAVFGNLSFSTVPFHYAEVSLMGDKTGAELGLIATGLWHKFAASSTVSHTQVLHNSRFNKVVYIPERAYQAINYSLSAGYLLLPKNYTGYKQTNLNLYAELLTQHIVDKKGFYADIGSGLQLIFNSNAKLNVGYRFQLAGNMYRMTRENWLISFERTFLNLWQ